MTTIYIVEPEGKNCDYRRCSFYTSKQKAENHFRSQFHTLDLRPSDEIKFEWLDESAIVTTGIDNECIGWIKKQRVI